VKQITLTQGKVALVDDADYEWLSQWSWCALHYRGKCGDIWYAKRAVEKPKHKTFLMHREIAARLELPEVDHKDHDGLNNQRFNLRPCTGTQNQGNRRKEPWRTSQFKGVSFYRQTGRWRVYVEHTHVGFFKDEIEAACAYDAAAVQHLGEFAKLNFPKELAV